MARSVWSDSISFGLVNVPVKAYTAVRDHDLHFNQLDKRSGARIRNKKVSEKTGREVPSDDIELGFGPADDTGKQAYGLLLAAMEERQKVAIGTVVMRNKQFLAAIRPLDGALAMSTMRFADEVVPRSKVDGVPDRRTKPDAKALQLATQIVDWLAGEWKPEQYHDTYAEELRARIDRKGKGKGKEIVEDAEAPSRGAQVLDLMEALEQSVSAAKSKRTTRKKAASRSPKSAKSKAKARKSA